jgi:hypothetical protein
MREVLSCGFLWPASGQRINGLRCGPLPLLFGLFGARIAFDGVRSHLHRASVHLLLCIRPLEAPSCLTLSKVVPSLSLSQPSVGSALARSRYINSIARQSAISLTRLLLELRGG